MSDIKGTKEGSAISSLLSSVDASTAWDTVRRQHHLIGPLSLLDHCVCHGVDRGKPARKLVATDVRRHGHERLFAYAPPEKTPGLLRRLFA
jgi:hypothetical protein